MDVEALRSIGLSLATDPLQLSPYSRDLWPRDTLRMFKEGILPETPDAVVWPERPEQVEAIVEWANKEGVTIVPFGAGSGVCGGARGRAGSLVVDLKRLNRILSVKPYERTVHVQSGLLGQHLEDQLEQIGWMTAHSPSSIACSTTGGYLAARSAGQFSSRYGVFDDILLAASAVTPKGKLQTGLWTPNSNEDLLPVLCGSEGGLGIVTDMLLRISPLPSERWLRGYAFPDLASAWTAMRDLMQAGLWPSVLRLYDPVDTKIGGKTSASQAKSGGGFAWMKNMASKSPFLQRHLLNLPLALPSLINKISAGISGEVLLIVGFDGPTPVVHASATAAQSLLTNARDLGPEPGEHWFRHRHDVSYKLAPVFIAGAFADTMEVAATWDKLPTLYQQVQAALGRHTAVMAHFSHAYPEGCSIYFSFMGRGQLQTYDATWKAALDAARAAGGTVTHHHGVGVLKSEAAAKEAGAAIRVWNEIKASHDPNGIMNPGRPFPTNHEPTIDDTLAPPRNGPIFSLDTTSLLATVDPNISPETLQSELSSQGYTLRIPPDRPFNEWLPLLARDATQAWETPVFTIQAVFDDGVRARIQPAPRSAAGPDLRWSLMRRATLETVQVPIRPLDGDLTITGGHPHLDIRDVRPAWHTSDGWGFENSQSAIADICNGNPSQQTQPVRSPEEES